MVTLYIAFKNYYFSTIADNVCFLFNLLNITPVLNDIKYSYNHALNTNELIAFKF